MLAVNMLFTVLCSGDLTPLNALTPEEEYVIVHKGTEHPFSGMYYAHKESGIYCCKRCDAPLYRSQDKFDAGCGWPSFDDELPDAVVRAPDQDGRRTEILCRRCGAHLGHVFSGEGFTPKNTRHCVNSLSLKFMPETTTLPKEQDETERAVFAGGCFWGVEYFFNRAPGVIATRVGYCGGRKPSPSYEEVCGGTTGHAEAVEVVFNPRQTDYEKMARLFFEIHDPTQINRQGPDRGEQYRSVIFYIDERQKRIAQKLIDELRTDGYDIVTQVLQADPFWPAEEYHQQYYEKKNGKPYCHVQEKRFNAPMQKINR